MKRLPLIALVLALAAAGPWASAQEKGRPSGPPTPIQVFENTPRWEYSMLQLHAFPNFQPTDTDLFKLMFERVKTFRYGDDYFFLGVNSDYDNDWSARTETLYFKYAAQLSMSRCFNTWVRPLPFIRDTLWSFQVNSGDIEYLRTVWLTGIAFDIAGLPNYGWLRIYALARQEDTMDLTHQVTVIWVQPFEIGKWKFVFNGWGAHWDNDYIKDVIKFEPQLRLRLSNFVGKKNIFYNSVIGAELEIGHHYVLDPVTHELTDWECNPSIFYAMPF